MCAAQRYQICQLRHRQERRIGLHAAASALVAAVALAAVVAAVEAVEYESVECESVLARAGGESAVHVYVVRVCVESGYVVHVDDVSVDGASAEYESVECESVARVGGESAVHAYVVRVCVESGCEVHGHVVHDDAARVLDCLAAHVSALLTTVHLTRPS